MAKISQRALNRLKKFAPIIGGIDENGVNHGVKKDNVLAQHIFYVRNQEIENPVGSFVLGDVIESKIRDDIYEIEYLGLQRDLFKPSTSNKIKKFQARHKELLEQQQKDIEAGKQAKDERQGIFTHLAANDEDE